MIRQEDQGGQHVDDAALIRLRDDECDGSEEQLVKEHLAICSQCREHADKIGRLADGLIAAIGEIQHAADLEPPKRSNARPITQRRSRRTSLASNPRLLVRIAAIIAVVLGLTFTATPARALISSGWQAFVGLFTPRSTERTVPEAVQPVVPPTPTALTLPAVDQPISKRATFSLDGEVFLIVFAHHQSSGTLSVVFDTVSQATAVALGNTDTDELIVSGTGARIRNREASTGSYVFRLPHDLLSIEVHIEGRTVATLEPGELAGRGEWQLDLRNAVNN